MYRQLNEDEEQALISDDTNAEKAHRHLPSTAANQQLMIYLISGVSVPLITDTDFVQWACVSKCKMSFWNINCSKSDKLGKREPKEKLRKHSLVSWRDIMVVSIEIQCAHFSKAAKLKHI